ncbi:putative Ig domain-containing protein [Undibacterium sp. Xuan67W]|uniref:putative Ig domain-containing protein n=1 Tax=Undibacterium sp. Xuan67W TaxID=3413057 RepID=UPI003BF210B2
MKKTPHETEQYRAGGWILAACAAALLSACGGTSTGESTTQQIKAQVASGVTVLQVDVPALPDAVAMQIAQPAFHLAPVLLTTPDNEDANFNSTSARFAPRQQAIPAEFRHLSSRHLTVGTMEMARNIRTRSALAQSLDTVATPMATSSVATYTPAQIRAAYGLPALPASMTGLTAAQAAQLGAGQTIYIVDAMHDPNVVAELTAFNQKFGLPTCITKTIATNAKLPLAAASSSTCELAIVYNTAAGGMTSAAPAYDSGWATEITLDVQWAHATAPLARIVLIEAADASLNSLLGAVKLANAMGPGVVSMSFGANEGSWTASVDAAFTAANMTYLAATGDNGAAVEWPSVSPNVVAVGGTTLTYSGTGARSEISWSGTGGGTSAYTATPSYQTSSVPGMGSVARRTVADVAFNADPSSGQYVATITLGSTAVNWVSAGGTSLSTPQWAGIIAIANASRAAAAKPAIGAPHAMLYGQIATVPGTYANAFADITKGSDGTCTTCTAKTGYDQLTGLGTPNVTGLLSRLTGTVTAAAPVVTPATITGQVGNALSFTVSATSANSLSYSLTGAPSGMSINSTAAVTWTTPVTGTYSVTVTATDTKSGLSGKGVYTVTIAAATPPSVAAATITGKVGTALSFSAAATATNPVTYSITGAPTGMSTTTAGLVSWATPVLGTYSVTVTATDSKTGLSGKGIYTINIANIPAPVVAAGSANGKVGAALSFSIAVTASNPVTYALSGAPSGMAISTSGVVSWTTPVVGTYSVTATAKDSKTGLTGQAIYVVTIVAASPAGPVITIPVMNGVAGKALTGTISISDPGVTSLSISISGAPMGMSFGLSGMNIIASWASPITGGYSLKVSVTDSAGRTAQVTIPITVAAK